MSEPKSANAPASTPDQLINSGTSTAVELSEKEMDGVSGGGAVNVIQDVTQNKQKTAIKAAEAMDAYIRS
jgi:hypothetical protein